MTLKKEQEALKSYRVALLKSLSGRKASHQASARGLGLRRIRHSVVVPGTPENMGMIRAIHYLVSVEELT